MEDFGQAKVRLVQNISLTAQRQTQSRHVQPAVCRAGSQSLRQAVARAIVALDGKALRRALNADQSIKYVGSAWAEHNGLVLGQWKVADKSNEITAGPELLRVLELAGCTVTVDA